MPATRTAPAGAAASSRSTSARSSSPTRGSRASESTARWRPPPSGTSTGKPPSSGGRLADPHRQPARRCGVTPGGGEVGQRRRRGGAEAGQPSDQSALSGATAAGAAPSACRAASSARGPPGARVDRLPVRRREPAHPLPPDAAAVPIEGNPNGPAPARHSARRTEGSSTVHLAAVGPAGIVRLVRLACSGNDNGEQEGDDVTSSPISRRAVLRGGAAGGLGIVVAGSLEAIAGPAAARAATRPAVGYGDAGAGPGGSAGPAARLLVHASSRRPARRCWSPGSRRRATPTAPAASPAANGSVLVNNHEIGGGEPYPVPALAGLTYDPGARGGTTTIEVDAARQPARASTSAWPARTTTAPAASTPWGTWLTCEETEQLARAAQFTKDHGYVFEVDPHEPGRQRRQPACR